MEPCFCSFSARIWRIGNIIGRVKKRGKGKVREESKRGNERKDRDEGR
jgi:hypothetical protein